jgi:hypothetical protein
MAISGNDALEVGIALGAAAWLWVLTGPLAFRRLVRARPLDGREAEGLAPLFSRILEKAKCGAPAIFIAEARGGSWVNAFALPAVRRPGVLFTRGFLGALTPGETAAICPRGRPPRAFSTQEILSAERPPRAGGPSDLPPGPLSDFRELSGFASRIPDRVRREATTSRAMKPRATPRLELADPDARERLTKLHSLNRLPGAGTPTKR